MVMFASTLFAVIWFLWGDELSNDFTAVGAPHNRYFSTIGMLGFSHICTLCTQIALCAWVTEMDSWRLRDRR